MSNLTKHESPSSVSIFNDGGRFDHAQRIAKMLVTSDLVPESYRNNLPNAMVALEMAGRVGASPLMVMQNLHVISGRPSWSSSFVIAALNSCGRFEPLRFRIEERGAKEISYEYWDGPKGARTKKTSKTTIQDRACVAWTKDRDGNLLEGPEVSIEMAVAEGWYTKADSKWKTMPDLMIRYRAAKFFGNLYAPDVLMGMTTAEELVDTGVVQAADVEPVAAQAPAPKSSPIDAINAIVVETVDKPADPEPVKAAPASRSGKTRTTEPAPQAEPEPVEIAQTVDDDDDLI
jgi:hypothetical protein